MRKKLLSVCLILAMVLPLMPATVWAVDEPVVAQIMRKGEDGETTTETFTKLEDAFTSENGARDGETVQLMTSIDVGSDGKDLTLSPAAGNITLDLNGKSITLKTKTPIPLTIGQLVIEAGQGAELTIKNGTIKQGPDSTPPDAAAVVVKSGTVTLGAGANIEAKGCGVRVGDSASGSGNLVVASGSILGATAANSNGIEVISGGAAVSAGKITGFANGIKVNDGSNNGLSVTGGTIQGVSNGIRAEGGTLIINGGTIEATGTGQSAGVAVYGSTSGTSTSSVSIYDDEHDGNAGITISGPIALYFDASAGTINASIWNGTFTGKGTGGKSISFKGTINPPNFIGGGQFVVRNNQNQLQKDPLPAESLADGRLQDANGVVYGRKADKVVITFNAAGGEFADEVGSTKRVEIIMGGTLSALPEPALKGYKFGGWYTAEGGAGEEITITTTNPKTFSEDTTLYAYWKVLIDITFDANNGIFDEKNEDGENMTQQIVQIGDGDPLLKSQLPGKPSRKEGDKEYTFLGWYRYDDGVPTPVVTAEEGTEENPATTFSKDGNKDVYALWGYTITFDPDGGTLKDGDGTKVTGAVNEETGMATLSKWPADPERAGYKFDSWYTRQGGKGDKFENNGDGTYYHPSYFDKPVTLYANWIKTKDVQLTVIDPIPAELTVNGVVPPITLKATGSVFVNPVTEDMFSLTLNGEVEEELYVTFANRTSDTEVVITLSKAPDAAGTLTVTVDESAFAFEIPPTKAPSVDIPVMHTITFDATPGQFEEGGSTITTTVKEGDVIRPPLDPTRDKYKFTGWYTEEDEPLPPNIEITRENIEDYRNLHAGWTQVKFTVKFYPTDGRWEDGESFKEKITGEDGRLPELPPEPTHSTDPDSYSFDGWYTQQVGGEKVTTETVFKINPDQSPDVETVHTVYAHWARSGKRTITFHANGDGHTDGYFEVEGNPTDWPIEIETEKLDEWPPDPVCDDHVFVGWYTQATGGEKVTAGYRFIDNTEVYAHWRNGPPYEITFDPGKGALVPGSSDVVETDVTTEDGTKGKLSEKYLDPKRNPTRDGYSFRGWYTEEGKLVTTDTEFDGPATIHARWGLTVTFDLNYETTQRTSTVEIELDEKDEARLPAPLPEPTRDGWYFDGWYTEPNDGEGEMITTEFVFVKASTIYAHWTEKEEYTVTFNANGGSVTPTSARTKDGKLSSLPTPTRDGYTFDGWFTAEEDGDKVTTDTVFTTNTTIYAHWTEKSSSDPEDPNDPSGPDTPDEPETQDTYAIRVDSTTHGRVSVASYAEPGTRVTITTTPDSDYEVDYIRVTRDDTGSTVSTGRTFTMPASDVTVTVKFSLRPEYNNFVPPQTQSQYQSQNQAQTGAPATLPTSVFKPVTWRPAAAMGDVPTTSWAYPAAQWAYQNGYLDTAADGTFQLNNTVSHMQLWKIMARWQGEAALDDNSVTQWARRTGASRIGTASGAMTRQNMVEYLYQCYFLLGGDVSVSGNLVQYRDSQMIVSASAKNAWIWAVNKGIISGTPDGALNPNGVLNRAEFASILMRLCQKG